MMSRLGLFGFVMQLFASCRYCVFAMRRSTLPFVVMLGLLFLMFGSVLPDPVGQYSTQMRQATNQFVTGLFPKQRPRLTPNERTQRQLEETENRR